MKDRKKFTARHALTIKEAGRYSAGDGLYLQVQVSKSGSITRSWLFRFMLAGKAREMGLGSVQSVGLADARDKARRARLLLSQGQDPLDIKHATRRRSAAEKAAAMTFAQCAEAYIEAHKAGWKNAKHPQQWANTIATYCGPVFGDWPVEQVDTAAVLRVLEPMWQEKHETATRVRGRVERVLDWATVHKLRDGLNPARWNGHMKTLLPAISKRRRVKHHPALTHTQISAFVRSLEADGGMAARALHYLILTACRTSEVIQADWSEIDLAARIWTIPGNRMKAGRQHRVPLSTDAIRLLESLGTREAGALVFPSPRDAEKPLSNMAMLALLRRMGRTEITAHGFRSTFRDWAGECTHHAREVIEHALAHQLTDEAEAAYARSDLLEKRRQLMNDWATHCRADGGFGTGVSNQAVATPY